MLKCWQILPSTWRSLGCWLLTNNNVSYQPMNATFHRHQLSCPFGLRRQISPFFAKLNALIRALQSNWRSYRVKKLPPVQFNFPSKNPDKMPSFSLVALFPFHFPSYTSSLAIQMHTLWSWLNTNKNINYQQNIWTPRFFTSGSFHNHSMRTNLTNHCS